MSTTLQWIIVVVLIAIAAVWLAVYIYRHRKDPCRGCAAAELCNKKNKKSGCRKPD